MQLLQKKHVDNFNNQQDKLPFRNKQQNYKNFLV